MAVKTETDREKEVLNGIIDVLKREIDPVSIYVFGSRAKGLSEYYSDFDIWVDSPEPSNTVKNRIAEEIEKFSGLYTVDVVFRNPEDAGFENMARRTGVVVYEK